MNTSLDEHQMRSLLTDLFRFEFVDQFSHVHGGYMSQNFRVETDRGSFFLKQYRNRMNTIIHEIKTSEQFFAHQGLPVILPTSDRYGREAFWLDGNWYSLFPFIDRQPISPEKLTVNHIVSSAKMLAHFHHAGAHFAYRPFQALRIGNAWKFHMEMVELVRILEQRQTLSELDEAILSSLQYKEEKIRQATKVPSDFGVTYDHLLHGDFQYTNMFFDDVGKISHIFDLERTCMGWPAYEIVRSTILNCFDGGWEEPQYELARQHLEQYRAHAPLLFDAYHRGVLFYAFNIIHTTWIEARYLVYDIHTQLEHFNTHVRRVHFFSTQDLLSFSERTFG